METEYYKTKRKDTKKKRRTQREFDYDERKGFRKEMRSIKRNEKNYIRKQLRDNFGI